MKARYLIVGAVLAAFAVSTPAQAYGIAAGAKAGYERGSKVAGPIGGVVGWAVGGVVGGVKGVVGIFIPRDTMKKR